MRKFFLGLIVFLTFTILSFVVFRFLLFNHNATFKSQNKQSTINKIDLPKAQKEIPKPLLEKVALPVPFTPQAPTANWDELHNDACEEASSLMVAEYFNPTPNVRSKTTALLLLPDFVEQEIDKMTVWLDQTYGYHLSTNTAETAHMIETVYDLKTTLLTNFTEADIKQALSENKLVIMPANGRLLGNPNFKAPGPIYHMLVITGYDDTGYITNDPGTKRGYNYRYNFQTLYNASAEWNHVTHQTDSDIKTIIIVEK